MEHQRILHILATFFAQHTSSKRILSGWPARLLARFYGSLIPLRGLCFVGGQRKLNCTNFGTVHHVPRDTPARGTASGAPWELYKRNQWLVGYNISIDRFPSYHPIHCTLYFSLICSIAVLYRALTGMPLATNTATYSVQRINRKSPAVVEDRTCWSCARSAERSVAENWACWYVGRLGLSRFLSISELIIVLYSSRIPWLCRLHFAFFGLSNLSQAFD